MPEPEPPPIRRSVSQFTSFVSCGEAVRLQRIAKAPSRPAGWFHQGTAAHKSIEDYENSGRTLTTAEAVEVFYSTYDALVAKSLEQWPDWDAWMTGGRKGGEADVTDRRVVGAFQVAEYIQYAEENAANWRVLASEVEFSLDLGGIEVYGFLDQIRQHADGSLEVADPKSGSSNPGSALQLGVYALAVEEGMGVRPEKACFIKLARPATTRAKAKPTSEIHHDLTPWTRELLTKLFRDFDKAERQGLYLPNATEDCHRTCSVAQWCRNPSKGHPESAAQFAHILRREDVTTPKETA